MGWLAAALKIPSRVTTYLEMFLKAGADTADHIAPLQHLVGSTNLDGSSFRLVSCDGGSQSSLGKSPCGERFAFGSDTQVLQFVGKPLSVSELLAALALS